MDIVGLAAASVLYVVWVLVVVSRRQGAAGLAGMMLGGAILRLGAMLTQHLLVLPRYEGGDFRTYLDMGRLFATGLADGRVTDVRPLPGTGTIDVISGVTQFLFGASPFAVSLVFTFLGWYGIVLVVDALVHRYTWTRSVQLGAAVLLLAPSTALWTSVLGKDAVVTLGAGVAVSGLVKHSVPRLLLGVLVTASIRPHVGAMLLIAVLASALVTRRVSGRRRVRFRRGERIAIIAACASALVVGSGSLSSYLGTSVTDLEAVGARLDSVEQLTGRTGSTGSAGIANLPHPVRAVLVPVRPLPFEASDIVQLLTSLEALAVCFALILIVRRGRRAAWRRVLRVDALAAFCAVYLVLFCLVFASISNMGLLARQRSQSMAVAVVLVVAFAAHARPNAARNTEPGSDASRPTMPSGLRR